MATKKTKVTRIEWFDGVGEILNQSAKTSIAGIERLREMIKTGTVMLYGVSVDSELIGVLTARIDRTLDGEKQLVCINVVEIIPTEMPYILRLHPVMTWLAKEHGATKIIVHAERGGMARRFERDGCFRLLEKIYIRGIEDG